MKKEPENLYSSILDRLIDEDPQLTSETQNSSTRVSVATIRNAVIRDIEFILNTKRSILHLGDEYPQLAKSVFAYGLPDFTAESPNNRNALNRLLKEIRQTISFFEPRLKNVNVQINRESGAKHGIIFTITGILSVYPIMERIAFDTKFNSNRSEYRIVR